nr:hypothetical protein [Tanacetum cinerariifolium]
MVEEPLKMKKKDQISFDEQKARRLQAEFDEQDKLVEEKAQLIEDENFAWDNVQAMMDADYELAVRLQEEEQGELTIEKKSKLFVELMDKRKKHFAKLKAEDKRRKPLTKAQKRNQMCVYLKNMVGFTYNQLKNKKFDEVQKAFDKTMSWINSFVPMDSKVVKDKATMFEHHVEDTVWRSQQGLSIVKSWKIFYSCRVYYVTMQNTVYYLLVEKMYLLTNHTLYQIFNNVKLLVDKECEMAYELLRLVKEQLKEGYRAN